MMEKSSRGSAVATQILFFLRFIQMGSTVLAGFIAIHFVYWHNRIHDPIPSGEIIFIVACSVAFLENYITSAVSLSLQGSNAKNGVLLQTSLGSSSAMSVGYYFLREVPFIRAWCEGDNNFHEFNGHFDKYGNLVGGKVGVEEHMCALTCVIIAAGAVALSFTIFVSLFAAVGLLMEKRDGRMERENDGDEYSDALLPGLEDSEKI